MGKGELERREKRIRYNFASIFMLISAIAITAIAGMIYVVNLFS